MSIPDLFRCPISLDLFTDPVTLSTGQTYDRPGIEKWLAGGNLTCPVTMQRLHDTSLVPNHTLKHLIDQWLLTGCDLNPNPKPTKLIDSFELSILQQNLRSPDATLAEKLEALEKIRVLSVESCLIHSGFFQLLLEMLFQTPCRHGNVVEVIELALECILNLSPSIHADSLNMLKQESYLASLVLLLEQGSTKIRTSLCYLLDDIATSSATCELSMVLGQTRRVLRALVTLLHDKTDANASGAALRAISSICSIEANRGNAIKEGAIDGVIVYLLNSTHEQNVSQALATLELLLGLETGKKAMSKNSDAVSLLVKMVFRVSSVQEGGEHAIGSLMILCSDSRQARVEAINSGVLTQLLLLLQSQSSSKAKDKAREFLKLLRAMWNEDQRWL